MIRIRARAAVARQLRRLAYRLHRTAGQLEITALHHALTNLRQQRTSQGATHSNHLHTDITTNTSTANKRTILDAIYHEDT
jgi:hypothetical protein